VITISKTLIKHIMNYLPFEKMLIEVLEAIDEAAHPIIKDLMNAKLSLRYLIHRVADPLIVPTISDLTLELEVLLVKLNVLRYEARSNPELEQELKSQIEKLRTTIENQPMKPLAPRDTRPAADLVDFISAKEREIAVYRNGANGEMLDRLMELIGQVNRYEISRALALVFGD